MGPIPAHPHAEANVLKGNLVSIDGDARAGVITRVVVNQMLDDGSARLDNAANVGNGRFENGTMRVGSEHETTTNLRGNGVDYVEKADQCAVVLLSRVCRCGGGWWAWVCLFDQHVRRVWRGQGF